jgi:hypothetical protein
MKKHSLLLTATLILALVALPPVPLVRANVVSWTSPGVVQQDYPSLDLLPSALQASNGSVWLAWQTNFYRGDASFDIAYKTGILGTSGVSWSAPVRLTNNAGQNSDPALAQLQNGTILLFWAYKAAANTNLFYERFTGRVWSNAVQLTYTTLNDTLPSAAVGKDGSLWLVWTRENATCGTCAVTRQLYYKTLRSGVWSSELPLTFDTANWNFDSSVLVGKDGIVRVAWEKGPASVQNFHIYYKTFNGTAWTQQETQIVTNSTVQQKDIQPSLVQDRNGTIWLFWARQVVGSSNSYYLVFSQYSIDNGLTWPSRTVTSLTSPDANQTQDSWQPSAIQSTNDKKIWLFYSTNPLGLSYGIWALTSVSPIAPVCDVGVYSLTPAYAPPNSLQYPGGQMGLKQSAVLPIIIDLGNDGDSAEIVSVHLTVSNSTNYNLSGNAYVNAGGSTNLQLNWNTTGINPGRYTLAATVSIITPSCTETVGNQPDSSLTVRNGIHIIPIGDVNQDGTVNILDLTLIAISFGSSVGSPLYNPYADIDGIGTINISDLVACALHFGQTG